MDDEQRSAAAALLEHLDERSRQIVSLRFGLDEGGKPRTLGEVAALFECSEEDVRKSEAEALAAIRRQLGGEGL